MLTSFWECIGSAVADSRQGVILTVERKTSLLRNVTKGLGIDGFCEHGSEPWGSIKRGEFLD